MLSHIKKENLVRNHCAVLCRYQDIKETNKQKAPNPQETKIATQQPVFMKLQLHSPSRWNSALGSGRSLSGGHRGTRKGLSFGPSIILIDVVKKDSQRKWIYSGCDET